MASIITRPPPHFHERQLIKGGKFEKNVIIEATQTHPDILHGGHRHPYQKGNAMILDGIVFSRVVLL